jgi:hypothetical protein
MSNAGARHLYKGGKLNIERYYRAMCGKAFFMSFIMADCDHIAIENPVPSSVIELPKCSQIIEPYYFGDPVTKKTCLWLKGLPELIPTKIVIPARGRIIIQKSGNIRRSCWTMDGNGSRERSKTFNGIAQAMADQWGRLLLNGNSIIRDTQIRFGEVNQ